MREGLKQFRRHYLHFFGFIQIKFYDIFRYEDAKYITEFTNDEMHKYKAKVSKGRIFEKKHKPKHLWKTLFTSFLLLFSLPSQPTTVIMGE